MARIERVDKEDSFVTTFIVENGINEHQEFVVPTFLANLVEAQIRTMKFDQEKLRNGKTTILD